MLKKSHAILAKFLTAIIASVFLLPMAHAADVRTGEQVNVSGSEQSASDLYLTGGSVTYSGSVTGDLVTAGGNVLVNGTVDGDVLAAGGTLTILGNVTDDVRMAGGNLIIGGTVGGDVVVGGGSVQLVGKGIEGDVLLGGGNVQITSPVGGNMRIGGGQIMINAPIAGNVEIYADDLTLGSAAVIEGNLNYHGPKEMKMESGAAVHGQTTYTPITRHEEAKQAARGIFSLFLFTKLLAMLACALVIGLLFRRYTSTLVITVQRTPWMELGMGLVMLIVWPIAAILLMVSILGLPFGIIALLAYIATLVFVSLVAPIVWGSLLYRWITKTDVIEISWKTILLGVVTYFLLGLIPVLGSIFCFVLFTMTLGAAMRWKKNILKEWR